MLPTEQRQVLEKLLLLEEETTNGWIEYWKEFSHLGTWQFWVNAAMLAIPLIVLLFLIDRKKAFHLGFFGFNVHVWFTYIDAIGMRLTYWTYPYQFIPVMPVNFSLDASLIPVTFMLLYQWVINHNKNYYLYMVGLSLFYSFIFKPIFVSLHLFELNKGANYFHLFLGYMVIVILSKWITNLFLYFEKRNAVK
jgi:hypothetical protein